MRKIEEELPNITQTPLFPVLRRQGRSVMERQKQNTGRKPVIIDPETLMDKDYWLRIIKKVMVFLTN